MSSRAFHAACYVSGICTLLAAMMATPATQEELRQKLRSVKPGPAKDRQAPPELRISAAAAPILKRAQQALARKDWPTATALLKEAEALPEKSESDLYVIDAMKTHISYASLQP